jgi:hypothetical protein
LAALSLCLSSDLVLAAPLDEDRRSAIGDPYVTPGIAWQDFTAYPFLSTALEIGDEPAPQTSLAPSLRLEHGSPDHLLAIEASADLTHELSTGEITDLLADWQLGSETRIAAATLLEFDAGYSFERDDGDEHTADAYVGVEHDFGQIIAKLDVGAAFTLLDPPDANIAFVEPEAALRLTHKLSDTFKSFVEVAYVPRYVLNGRDNAPDTEGLEALIGFEVESSPEWTGEIALIYLHERNGESLASFGLNADLVWRPVAATELIFSAAASMDRRASGQGRTIPLHEARLEINHALRDDVRLTAALAAELEIFRNARDRLTLTPELALAWQFHPNMAWTAGAEMSWASDDGEAEGLSFRMGFEFRI